MTPQGGIRFRVTLTATIIVAAALLTTGVTLVLLVQQALVSSLDTSASSRSRDIAALIVDKRLPSTLPGTGEDTSLAQVVTSSNHVIASTSNIQGEAPVITRHPSTRIASVSTTALPALGNSPFRLQATPVSLGTTQGWIYVASSLDQTTTAVARLITLFAIGLPLVLLIVVLIVWRSVGAVLRPVDAIQTQASRIGGTNLTHRVPVPEGTDEIARLAQTVNSMLDRLEAASDRQQQFIGDASHELRSPLAALRTEIDVALTHPDSLPPETVLKHLHDQVLRLGVLTDDLLFLARQDENTPPDDTPPSTATTVNTDDLVLAEVKHLRGLGGVAIRLDTLTPAQTTGSPRDLTRMLRNIGDNAYQHALTTVTFRLTATDTTARISVTDDGPGIAPPDRERVFERFTRLDPSRARSEHGPGAGLGLAIARQIIRNHHGTITITDPPDTSPGTQFVIELPSTTSRGHNKPHNAS